MSRTKALESVRKAREAKLVSREQLAKKLKITPAYVGGIESGSLAHLISARVADSIRETFGADVLPAKLVEEHNAKVMAYRKRREKARMGQKSLKIKTKDVFRAKAKRTKPVVKPLPKSRQGFLPGFLDGETEVRMDEMIQDYLYKRLQERIDEKLDLVFGVRKQG